MRLSMLAFLILGGSSLAVLGCGDPPIGQPCLFNWPKGSDQRINCEDFPTCHPLQDVHAGSVSVNNQACPIDCIQMPSLECEDLICVATQIEGDHTHMNGQCYDVQPDEETSPDCVGQEEKVRCQGYCTKECLTDAGCPKGYKCSAMAPFEATLRCEQESEWGTQCTDNCVKEGESPNGGPETCPGSNQYDICDRSEYAGCCTCICFQFCPLLNKKFCRKTDWDQNLFAGAITTATHCGEEE